mgnify:CR=1 FL=1
MKVISLPVVGFQINSLIWWLATYLKQVVSFAVCRCWIPQHESICSLDEPSCIKYSASLASSIAILLGVIYQLELRGRANPKFCNSDVYPAIVGYSSTNSNWLLPLSAPTATFTVSTARGFNYKIIVSSASHCMLPAFVSERPQSQFI